MPNNCPSCAMKDSETSRKAPTWIPFVTAVGVSAAALFVFHQVRKSQGGVSVDRVLNTCTRAASDLERRLNDTFAAMAG